MAELIWDGKYDATGKKNAPLRVVLPFQTVETVNESAQQRQKSLFAPAPAHPEWRNRLIWGDKKYVLPSLLPEFAGKVDLIYIDPPFNVGANFSFQAQVGDEQFTKQPNLIEQKAYRDTWGRGIDGYMQWFYETAVILYELLAETGSLYVHLDWHVGHYAKAVLDEVFGYESFRNEIIWKRTTAHSNTKQGSRDYGGVHDTILFYSKSPTWEWNPIYMPYDDSYVRSHYSFVEEGTERRFRADNLTAAKAGGDTEYEWRVKRSLPDGAWTADLEDEHLAPRPNQEYKGVLPYRGRYWAYSYQNMAEFEKQGKIYYAKSGMPNFKRYLDEMPGVPLQDLWTDIQPINSQAVERVGYPTQKPEALLERIIRASSIEDNLIFDCFCGSGATATVAEKLNRRWITCDLGRFAIHTTRKRLLEIENVRPFIVQNLGKYERQAWQQHEFGADAAMKVRAYRRFLLDLYHAEPIEGYTWLHGRKGGRMVHVGTVDSPVAPNDVQQIAIEFRKAIGRGENAPTVAGVDVLGWDFALEMNEVSRQIAADAGLDVRFIRIPREVLEPKAVEQGDIRFFELAALGLDIQQKGRRVTVKLTDFMVPPDDVPENVQQAVSHWSEWIDYWAVDFNFRDDTFHNEWQSYRTRKDRKLELQHAHDYASPGAYTAVVKVIDILGNDTTKSVQVVVK